MLPLPHHYNVTVDASAEQSLQASADQLPDITIAPPAEFGGPGNQWSPEHLLMSSVASCLVLTFQAIAKVAGLEWRSISCRSQGKLDKVERKAKFTEIHTTVKTPYHR